MFLARRVFHDYGCDLRHWLLEPMPVILALYDALNDTAYWRYAQDYLSHHPEFDLERIGSVTVRLSMGLSSLSQPTRLLAEWKGTVRNGQSAK